MAVNKCTASVDTLKEQFKGLKEIVALTRQDLQKVREITTSRVVLSLPPSLESRISDLEDQLPPPHQGVSVHY